MSTSLGQLAEWFERGKAQKATHMIVVCDTFDHEDYPVFAKNDAECLAEYAAHDGKNMQRVMEVYDLRKSWTSQGKGGKRVFNLPVSP